MTTNTSRGLEFYKNVSEETNELINVEREYKERLLYKPSLIHPFERHPLNAEFVKLYKKKDTCLPYIMFFITHYEMNKLSHI